MQGNFSLFQYSILILYVLASVSVGLWFARSQKSVEGYYLAERSAPSWAVAISIISSDTTAISYLGVAALVFSSDLQLSMGTLAVPFAAIFVCMVFVPFLARFKVFTIYEYLEHRFNVQVRTVASALFMLTRGSHLSVGLYAAALALAQVMGMPIWASLLTLGGLTTLYTVFGGMKAVLWTDVIQFFVLMGGVIAVLVGVAMAFHWDFAQIWQIASHPPSTVTPWSQGQPDTTCHTRMFDFGTSFYQMTFWIVSLNTFLTVVGSYGSDQVLVQRYLATGSGKKMAVSLIGGSLIMIPVTILLYATGVFLVAYYSHFLNVPGHEWVNSLTDSNRVMAHFISHGLPSTLGAIVIAGLFAGTMSSFSAGLNSLSTATYIDFLTRFGKKDENAKEGVRHAKVVTCLWGIGIILGAKLIGGSDTIVAILAKVMSPFAGPLLGMFLLGMLSRRANSFGVIAGALVGAAATVYVTYFTKIHWLWYFVVGSMTGLVAGYLLSFLRTAQKTVKAPAVILTCVVLAVFATASRAEEARMRLRVAEKLAAGRENVRIVAFGDSITGVYYHTGGRRAWPEMLQVALRRLYPQAKLEVINAGISGNDTVAALARLQTDVLSKNPDLVVAMFGMNDVCRFPPEQYKGNLREIVTRSREAGAEVVLCTPNSVYEEDAGRSMPKLAAYADLVRGVARELNVPVADNFAAYESIRARDTRAWMELMSETIHPNMRGHKVMAEEVACVIGGHRVSLRDVGPLHPGLSNVLARLRARQPVRVIAMPPYDEMIGPALRALDASARVEVTRWETAGQSLAQIETEAKARGWLAAHEGRALQPRDLVVVAVPSGATAANAEDYYRRYTSVLNWSLSYDRLTWDCLVLLPSIADPELDQAGQTSQDLAMQVACGQDLPYLSRTPGDATPAGKLITAWVSSLAQ